MKNLFKISLSLLFVLVLQTSVAQDKTITVAKSAFQTANVGSLSQYLHSEVAVVFEDEQSAAGKSAAENSLRSFFAKHSVTNFDFIHQGNSKDGKTFVVGKYDYAGGCYRVRIILKNYSGEYLIDNIDFSKE
jgi:hypothetical protein